MGSRYPAICRILVCGTLLWLQSNTEAKQQSLSVFASIHAKRHSHRHQKNKQPSEQGLHASSRELPSAPFPLAPAEGFVRVNGTRFNLNGKPFYFTGTNIFNIGLHGLYTDEQLEEAFAFYVKHGIKVIRFFAFSNGFNKSNIFVPKPIQPDIGNFDEEALQRLDYILAKGGAVGLRFILVLGNYEPELGGIAWYVLQTIGAGQEPEQFYLNYQVKQAYKQYMHKVITRVNTITGRPYYDDPAILAWEPMNEPHTRDKYEMHKGWLPGHIVYTWLDEMTTYIKQLDVNHLVATGEEGYRTSGKFCWPHFHWINAGTKGIDYVTNLALPNVDFATIHVYPDNWGIPFEEFDWVNENFIADRSGFAHGANKPIIIEEFGATGNYHPDGRDFMFRSLINAAHENDIAGLLVWEYWAPEFSGEFEPTGYDFPHNDSGTKALLEAADFMNAKSAGIVPIPSHPLAYHKISGRPTPKCTCIDVAPIEGGCDIQVQYNKCNEKWMKEVWPPVCDSPQGYCAKSCGRCSCEDDRTDDDTRNNTRLSVL